MHSKSKRPPATPTDMRCHPLQVSEHTTDKKKMNEPSMVLYNNLLSIPPILVLGAFFGEYQTLLQQPALNNPVFWFVATLGGLIGFASE